MTLPESLEPQTMYNQQYLDEAVASARAEALREAAGRAVEYLFRHGTYMSTACYEAGNLRRAILADKQESQ